MSLRRTVDMKRWRNTVLQPSDTLPVGAIATNLCMLILLYSSAATHGEMNRRVKRTQREEDGRLKPAERVETARGAGGKQSNATAVVERGVGRGGMGAMGTIGRGAGTSGVMRIRWERRAWIAWGCLW